MKKLGWLLMVAILLCGCSAEQTLETVTDELWVSTMAPQKELTFQLPDGAGASAMAAEDGAQLYFCDGYTLTVQTTLSGDMTQTIRNLCGYDRQKLTVMETKLGGLKRYDWTWTSAGEGSVQVGRAAVLDDGDYHYCVTTMAEEAHSGSLNDEWDRIFSSFSFRR